LLPVPRNSRKGGRRFISNRACFEGILWVFRRPRSRFPRLIYDKACDSDPLRKRPKLQGIDLICPHRINRVKKPTQDGRKLRRYRRRWNIERTMALLATFCRLVVRLDHHIHIYRKFFHVACLMIVVRKLQNSTQSVSISSSRRPSSGGSPGSLIVPG
jgi:transposase